MSLSKPLPLSLSSSAAAVLERFSSSFRSSAAHDTRFGASVFFVCVLMMRRMGGMVGRLAVPPRRRFHGRSTHGASRGKQSLLYKYKYR